jgi:prepilin-type N-terminal cleavage/methylation domain-containing protein
MGVFMNNKGFTLLELIVAVAILAVAGGMTANIIQNRNYSDVTRSANQISATLDRVRTDTISKSDRTFIYLYGLNGSCFIQTSKGAFNPSRGGKRIGNSRVRVTYRIGGSVTDIPLEDGDHIEITYKRGTGAFYRADGNFYSQIRFTNNLNSTAINLVEGTGRHYLN